jgi:hypothetical protein
MRFIASAVCVVITSLATPAFAQSAFDVTPKNDVRKDPSKDPGPGRHLPGRDDGSAAVHDEHFNWDWGVVYQERTYNATLTIKNFCLSQERVSLFVTDFPLLAPKAVTLPPALAEKVPSITTVPVTLGPTPKVPQERIDQGLGLGLEGRLVVWHPWTKKCMPRRQQYDGSAWVIPVPKPAPNPNDRQKAPLRCFADATIGRAPHGAPSAQMPGPQDDQDCQPDSNVDDSQIAAVKADIKQLARKDPTLHAPEGAAMDAELAPLSLPQLLALRNRLRSRVNGLATK